MKRKIISSLLAIFLFFSIGAAIAMLCITDTTSELNRIIKMQDVEELRLSLLINIQTVQSDLHSLGNPSSEGVDTIIRNVSKLQTAAEGCTSCHLSPR
jgi:predicted PurR-regulated permease PerM